MGTDAGSSALAGAAFQAASFASPSLRASSAAFAATTCSRTCAFTSSNGLVRAGEYCAMRPATIWFGPNSTASVLRLRSTASGANSAFRNFGFARGPVAPQCSQIPVLVVISSPNAS